MKKLMATAVGTAAFGLSAMAFAGGGGMAPPDDAGWYLGGQVGFGLTYWDNLDVVVNNPNDPANPFVVKVGKEDGFAGRLHVGYNFNNHFGAEFGWAYLPSSVTINGVGKIRNWAFDLSGKMYAPLMDQFGAFARLGVSYLRSEVRSDLNRLAMTAAGERVRTSNWNVTYGAGVYYDYTPQLRFTAEWQRFHGKADVFNAKYQPFMDAYTVGLSYRLPEDLLAL